LNILEIGSFEGMSTVFFLEFFKKSNITCVDIFDNYRELPTENFNKIYKNFLNNTKDHSDRIQVFKDTSDNFFSFKSNKLFDIIYVDGNHHYDYVLRDAINSFERLQDNGIIIFDDFLWNFYDDIDLNPIGAIKEFISIYFKRIKIIHIHYQIIIQKLR
tara:strand:- start:79 stop:555 length:477 start_codon:yes stop_codon:yes gene_type:complete